MQLSLFQPDDQYFELHEQMRELAEQQNKMRKSLYARNNELEKTVQDLRTQLAEVKETLWRQTTGISTPELQASSQRQRLYVLK